MSSGAVPRFASAADEASGPREPRRVLVTGASRGIGLAITTRLLRSGWHVTGVSRQVHEIAKGLDADHAQRFHSLAID
ncbi:MAG TPA: SDR family NAD(P)-dependent oxidoreductase, partial [Planctomycetota bacterium]|nr:SDR family NAD(P)-dependent oxidoreductase [Planctomycetota bacterium]